jgi:hypothetical protein
VPQAANALGLDAMGIELSPLRVRKARHMQLSSLPGTDAQLASRSALLPDPTRGGDTPAVVSAAASAVAPRRDKSERQAKRARKVLSKAQRDLAGSGPPLQRAEKCGEPADSDVVHAEAAFPVLKF